MADKTPQDIKIEHLEKDVKEIKDDVSSFRDHVIRCDERQQRREKAEKDDREKREKREEKNERRFKMAVGAAVIVLGWLLGVEGREEVLNLLGAL